MIESKARRILTDATWNPVTGCTKVSAGCDHCYAEAMANTRLRRDHYLARLPVVPTRARKADPFAVRLWSERLDQPVRWTRPRMIFVNSMSDLFHADIPYWFAVDIWNVMLATRRHVYQVLTKRPSRGERFWKRYRAEDRYEEAERQGLSYGDIPPPPPPIPSHIWVGTSIEDARVLCRIRHLRRIPAQVRFLSIEPLIGPVGTLDLDGIHWVIVGGESGRRFRPIDPDWVRDIRDQCVEAGVPFFFKQWGGRTPKANGRFLDGRTWDEMPAIHQGGTP